MVEEARDCRDESARLAHVFQMQVCTDDLRKQLDTQDAQLRLVQSSLSQEKKSKLEASAAHSDKIKSLEEALANQHTQLQATIQHLQQRVEDNKDAIDRQIRKAFETENARLQLQTALSEESKAHTGTAAREAMLQRSTSKLEQDLVQLQVYDYMIHTHHLLLQQDIGVCVSVCLCVCAVAGM